MKVSNLEVKLSNWIVKLSNMYIETFTSPCETFTCPSESFMKTFTKLSPNFHTYDFLMYFSIKVPPRKVTFGDEKHINSSDLFIQILVHGWIFYHSSDISNDSCYLWLLGIFDLKGKEHNKRKSIYIYIYKHLSICVHICYRFVDHYL